MKTHYRWIVAIIMSAGLAGLFGGASPLHAQMLPASNAVLATKVAPGELLPLTIRLDNTGTTTSANVSIRYDVVDASGAIIATTIESTVVRTSEDFLAQISLPPTVAPGDYTVRITATYSGGKAPATATQAFTVEDKVLGFFASDFNQGLIFFLAGALIVLLAALLNERRLHHRTYPTFRYPQIPAEQRMYYEMLSDIIQQVRQQEGDRALELVADIPGLTIETATGRVLSITGKPSAIIAAVVAGYEKKFDDTINLSLSGKDAGHAIVTRPLED